MRKATGSFAAWGCEDCKKCCDKPEMLVKDEVLVDLVVDLYGNIDKTEALEMLNTNENMKTILRNLINTHTVNLDYIRGNTSVNPNWDLQYSIKPGYIMTNVPCGYLNYLTVLLLLMRMAILWYQIISLTWKQYIGILLRRLLSEIYKRRMERTYVCKYEKLLELLL